MQENEIVRVPFLCMFQVEGEVTENTTHILASSFLVEVIQNPKIPSTINIYTVNFVYSL